MHILTHILQEKTPGDIERLTLSQIVRNRQSKLVSSLVSFRNKALLGLLNELSALWTHFSLHLSLWYILIRWVWKMWHLCQWVHIYVESHSQKALCTLLSLLPHTNLMPTSRTGTRECTVRSKCMINPGLAKICGFLLTLLSITLSDWS